MSTDIFFRKLPYFDKKWLKADLVTSLRAQDERIILYNTLIEDNELSKTKFESVINCCGNFSYLRSDGKYYCGAEVLNCSCCDKVCNSTSSCVCVACQLIDLDDKKSPITSSDSNYSCETFFDLWGPIPGEIYLLFTNSRMV